MRGRRRRVSEWFGRERGVCVVGALLFLPWHPSGTARGFLPACLHCAGTCVSPVSVSQRPVHPTDHPYLCVCVRVYTDWHGCIQVLYVECLQRMIVDPSPPGLAWLGVHMAGVVVGGGSQTDSFFLRQPFCACIIEVGRVSEWRGGGVCVCVMMIYGTTGIAAKERDAAIKSTEFGHNEGESLAGACVC